MNKNVNSIKNIIALELPLVGIIVQVLLYAYLWFTVDYPLVALRLKFYRNGHLLVLALYFILLMFFMATYGGMNVGYMKVIDVVLSQTFSLILVNMITYVQDSLMRNWMLPVWPTVLLTCAQVAVAVLWVNVCDRVYKKTFPPKDLILIHGDRPYGDIVEKFKSRPDKYHIVENLNIEEGIEAIEAKILESRNGVILWDLPAQERNDLIKFCYENTIRLYMMPKIPDVLIKGAEQLHVFDTPVYMTREYALTFMQRLFKRTIDVVCALILLVLTSPFFLLTAILVKAYDRGLYFTSRCAAP